jgi:hypothetical protein
MLPIFALKFFSKLRLQALCIVLFGSFLYSAAVFASAEQRGGMPDELYEGLVKFKLNSERYYDALTLMDSAYIARHPVDYATALHGFNLLDEGRALINKAISKPKKMLPEDFFNSGRIYYSDDDCIGALKAFKKLKNKLSLEDKQKWVFYRANCFIRLGSDSRAAKVLTDMIGGVWASYAYFNLAMSYAEGSRDKTKALVALRVAESLNQGKTDEEKALNDRINLAAGSLYLEGKKPALAIEFLKKVHLKSDSSAAALYLHGLAKLESGDFRSATQSWFSAKTYPLINQSVSESILAIPYAYERSGYISQALEAYLEASTSFERELRVIDKVDAALETHGAQKVLIESSEIAGLEWFLAQDVVKNTTRAAYYRYLAEDDQIYDDIELHAELGMLLKSLNFWASQLAVFEGALNDKRTNFDVKRASFDPNSIKRKIAKYEQAIRTVKQNKVMNAELAKNIRLDALENGVATLKLRLKSLKGKVSKGQEKLKSQLGTSKEISQQVKEKVEQLEALRKKLDVVITKSSRERLAHLRHVMLSNYERAEQGLVHIFQGIAENKSTKKKNRLDGRYK